MFSNWLLKQLNPLTRIKPTVFVLCFSVNVIVVLKFVLVCEAGLGLGTHHSRGSDWFILVLPRVLQRQSHGIIPEDGTAGKRILSMYAQICIYFFLPKVYSPNQSSDSDAHQLKRCVGKKGSYNPVELSAIKTFLNMVYVIYDDNICFQLSRFTFVIQNAQRVSCLKKRNNRTLFS